MTIEKILNDFENLKEAWIDASSIIYLEKIKLLEIISKQIKLYTIDKIIGEIGFIPEDINIKKIKETALADDLLIKECINNKNIIISDDYEILKKIEKCNLPFFNSGMLICFLYFKQVINKKEFKYYRDKLRKIAYYSDVVWKYIDETFLALASD